jgi:phosphate transport system permease protein
MPEGDGRTRTKAGAPRARRSRFLDAAFRLLTSGVGAGLILLLGLLVFVLSSGASRAFARFGLGFLTGRNWNPVIGRESFGALPLIFGTLATSAIAIVIAVPIAVGLALLLNDIRGALATPLASFVDLLAAIPSVVYGLWGLFVLKPIFDRTVEPFLQSTLGKIPGLGTLFAGNPNGPDLLTAGVILAIMILPIVTAISREVVAVVPRDLKEASLALGATRYEAVRMAILPHARSGIVGATMLGLGRALGETIAVSMVVGNVPQIHASLLGPAATIPSWIASSFREATSVGLHRSALLALAVVLVGLAFLLALASRLLVGRTERLLAAPTVEGAVEGQAFRISQ